MRIITTPRTKSIDVTRELTVPGDAAVEESYDAGRAPSADDVMIFPGFALPYDVKISGMRQTHLSE